MPIPFIIAGAAIALAGYGAKKGYDAKCDYDDAKKINKNAKSIYSHASNELNEAREEVQYSLEALGILKFEIYKNSIIPFINAFSKIKNLEGNISIDGTTIKLPDRETINNIREEGITFQEMVSGGIGALGAGGLSGLAAYGGAGALASASTGTAIGSLSGVAATNATLAWFGGGSLASGGLGMAGGMAVLGGIIAGPVLAVGGMMLASKAEAAKEDAYSNLELAKTAVEEMKLAQVKTEGIGKKVLELGRVLNQLNEQFKHLLNFTIKLTSININFNTYNDEQKKAIFISYSVFETLSNLLNVKLLNNDGELNNVIQASINHVPIEIRKNNDLIQNLLERKNTLSHNFLERVGYGNKIMNALVPEKKSLQNIITDLTKNKELAIDNLVLIGRDDMDASNLNPDEHTWLKGKPLLVYENSSFLILLTDTTLFFKQDDSIDIDDIFSIWIDENDKVHINQKIFAEYGNNFEILKLIVELISEYKR